MGLKTTARKQRPQIMCVFHAFIKKIKNSTLFRANRPSKPQRDDLSSLHSWGGSGWSWRKSELQSNILGTHSETWIHSKTTWWVESDSIQNSLHQPWCDSAEAFTLNSGDIRSYFLSDSLALLILDACLICAFINSCFVHLLTLWAAGGSCGSDGGAPVSLCRQAGLRAGVTFLPVH